jgi:hypothetical protein
MLIEIIRILRFVYDQSMVINKRFAMKYTTPFEFHRCIWSKSWMLTMIALRGLEVSVSFPHHNKLE